MVTLSAFPALSAKYIGPSARKGRGPQDDRGLVWRILCVREVDVGYVGGDCAGVGFS
jgi:hypothetical protein